MPILSRIGRKSPQTRLLISAIYAALGLGFLDKGPVAWALVALTLAGVGFMRNNDPAIPRRRLMHAPGILLAIGLGLSWYLFVIFRDHTLFKYLFVGELVDRVATGHHGREEAWYFFLPLLLVMSLPWLPSLSAGCVWAAKNFHRDRLARLVSTGIVLPVIMFTLSKSKLPAYILPLLPCAALMAAKGFSDFCGRPWFRRLQTGWATLTALGLLIAVVQHGIGRYGWTGVWTAEAIAFLVAAVALFVGGAVRAMRPAAMRYLAAGIFCCYATVLSMLPAQDGRMDSKSSARAAAEAIREVMQPGDRIVIFRNSARGFSFYLPATITIHDQYSEIYMNDALRAGNAGRIYADKEGVQRVAAWLQKEPRVFVITTDNNGGGNAKKTPLEILKGATTRPVREIHRDAKYVVICNFAS